MSSTIYIHTCWCFCVLVGQVSIKEMVGKDKALIMSSNHQLTWREVLWECDTLASSEKGHVSIPHADRRARAESAGRVLPKRERERGIHVETGAASFQI